MKWGSKPRTDRGKEHSSTGKNKDRVRKSWVRNLLGYLQDDRGGMAGANWLGGNEIRDVAKIQNRRAWQGMASTLNFIGNTLGSYRRIENKGNEKTDLNV